MFTEWVDKRDERRGFKLSESVTIRSFDQATIHQQVSEIQELPQGLMNHYVLVDHQAQKLGHLLGFLKEMSGQRIIIFFATCASVDYHYLTLKTIL